MDKIQEMHAGVNINQFMEDENVILKLIKMNGTALSTIVDTVGNLTNGRHFFMRLLLIMNFIIKNVVKVAVDRRLF